MKGTLVRRVSVFAVFAVLLALGAGAARAQGPLGQIAKQAGLPPPPVDPPTADPVVNTIIEVNKSKDNVDTATRNAGEAAKQAGDAAEKTGAAVEKVSKSTEETLKEVQVGLAKALGELAELRKAGQANMNALTTAAIAVAASIILLVLAKTWTTLRPRDRDARRGPGRTLRKAA